jgi:hypothetical protein
MIWPFIVLVVLAMLAAFVLRPDSGEPFALHRPPVTRSIENAWAPGTTLPAIVSFA